MTITILTGDALEVLRTLPAKSVQCCVTSPPYYGLRDYGHEGQIGLEPSPAEYVARLVDVFREVRRVLRKDGTCWVNLGDSYANGSASGEQGHGGQRAGRAYTAANMPAKGDVAPKNLLGIPWRVAFALQSDGWFLRSEVIWHKPNPMPESVTDRPTKAHEQVFLLTKAARYFYDADAIRKEPTGRTDALSIVNKDARGNVEKRQANKDGTKGANCPTVWTIATQPYSGAHFATMPPALAERCILAGSRPGDMVLDPFGGAGTTGLVADRLQRNATLIELNPTFATLARDRVAGDAGMFAEVRA